MTGSSERFCPRTVGKFLVPIAWPGLVLAPRGSQANEGWARCGTSSGRLACVLIQDGVPSFSTTPWASAGRPQVNYKWTS